MPPQNPKQNIPLSLTDDFVTKVMLITKWFLV